MNHFDYILYQITARPTPTLLPNPGIPPVNINSSNFRIWNFTDESIMIWQQMGSSAQNVFQIALILVIIIVAIGVVMFWIKQIPNESDN